MTIIDYKTSIVQSDDLANKIMLGRVNSKTVRLMLYTRSVNASWAANRAIKHEGYPVALYTLPCNRDSFRLEVGDNFIFSDPNKGIVSTVLRVLNITEEDLNSETIVVNAIEDVEYLSSTIINTGTIGQSPFSDWTVDDLENIYIIEAPYALSGNDIEVVPLAAREGSNETGYVLYMSIDGGSSYNMLSTITTFNPHGTLVADYTADTYQIDDQVGFQITFSNDDVDQISSITRTQLMAGHNLALLGDEIISFMDITPVSGYTYSITGIYRGRLDTVTTDHSAGEDFFFGGTSHFRRISAPEIQTGVTRQFKMVPYNIKSTGDIATASGIELTITGRAKEPYTPWNIKANDEEWYPLYTTDIVLDWDSRIRGTGAGVGDADTVTDTTPTYEGAFDIDTVVSGSVVRSTTVSGLTWTYTSAMNISDNGALMDEVTFTINNFRIENTITYSSDNKTIIVTKES